ncbi:MAG: IMP dehydrogenase, partial [Betaproteobacteria bacterium]
MNRITNQGITFDDVLLEPAYSEIVPRDADVRTLLTRNIYLNIPILSSPMDTVTESDLAIALAQEGGMGVIHKNMSISDQTREVDKVKRSENGIIVDPITLPPEETVGTARKIMEEHKVSGVPITSNGFLRGILTRRDLKFLLDNQQKIDEVMTKNNLITASESTKLEDAERILTKNKVEKLLLVDDHYRLKGLITIKDIDKLTSFPQACKDVRGRLRVGAAVGVYDYERVESLIKAGVDVLVVDSAHGHSGNVLETVRRIKKQYSIEIIAGNVATGDGASALVQAGADIVAPSGMIDGMVGVIRESLDDNNYDHIPILSYSIKYASALYGPFRVAAEGAPKFGDRRSYQADYCNINEAVKEVALDIEEGADMVMVKPAHTYLDVIHKIKQIYPEIPLAAYHTSGEYAM